MKSFIFLVLLGLLLAVNGTIAQTGNRTSRLPGGSSHLRASRSARNRHATRRRSNSVLQAHHISKNVTLNGHHASSVSVYSGLGSPTRTPVAPFRVPSSHAEPHNMPRDTRVLDRDHSSLNLTYVHRYSNQNSRPATISDDSVVRVDNSTKTSLRASRRSPLNTAPTPAPTAPGSSDTTVHVNDENDFALLLPRNPGELISEAEADGVSYCSKSGCPNTFPEGFITAASVMRAPDGISWIQVTGCIDPSKSTLSQTDDGGQFDVRFPNGAQCTFGGYGASFIEQIEPASKRFCLRCCAAQNDQVNCNSHQDRAGCAIAVPGTYDFLDKGVSCA